MDAETERESQLDWYGDGARVFQNPRGPLPAPGEETLPRGALLFATSGSSGRPKWVAHTRSSLLASAAGVNRHLRATAGDVWLCGLPAFHGAGRAISARACLAGCRVETMAGPWSPERFTALAARSGATLTSLVPAQAHDLVARGLSAPPSLRAVIIGGGALSRDCYFAARRLGWPLLPSYGLTEAGSQVATAPLESLDAPEWPEPRILDHWEARTAEADGLEIRGPALFHGYYLQTADGGWEWTNPFRHDWFRCADRVRLGADGGLQWLGRSDRVVKILGELVDLDQVEQTLTRLAGREILLLPAPDARLGWRLEAVAEGADFPHAALAAYHAQCPPFARVAASRVVGKFPRSPLGKVLRAEIATMPGIC